MKSATAAATARRPARRVISVVRISRYGWLRSREFRGNCLTQKNATCTASHGYAGCVVGCAIPTIGLRTHLGRKVCASKTSLAPNGTPESGPAWPARLRAL